MKKILVIGAGLSATVLIDFLLEHAERYGWQITVADISLDLANKKVAGHPRGRAIKFDIFDSALRAAEISRADIVISMLPGSLHPLVATECLTHCKHMLSPSYVTSELREMNAAVHDAGLVFLNELGVDPGIDHMSAMRVIDKVKSRGGKLLSFKSFCGGLVAPACDDNPWKYKFSWNPRNVVLAGQGVATFREQGRYRYVPYHRLFSTLSDAEVPGYGKFEVYPNRDSLQYCQLYGLDDLPTIIRGTMRRPGYAAAWDVFVQLGCTDDSFTVENSHQLSYRQFIECFLPYHRGKTVRESLADFVGQPADGEIFDKIEWLGLFSDEKIGLQNATPAQIMQQVLLKKWSMTASDRDLLVMQHQFVFEQDGAKRKIVSSMTYEGVDNVRTAMAYTVGLPLGIAAKLLATGEMCPLGVQLPLTADIYNPILDELAQYGINFTEEEFSLSNGS
jgi:saccharopine dehydrogenase (NADP+, L-glutamate forming)